MVQKAKTQRVKLEIVKGEDGNYRMRRTTDSTVTLPFCWPSEASAKHDLSTIIQGLMMKGFVVVDDDGKEVTA